MTGPKVVAMGGGHGLAATLRAARQYAGDITGVVSVADDGGSSGRLRQALGIPPPGDLRKCLVALAEDGSTWARALEHRFGVGELSGHSLGNLIIAGLTEATGDFLAALSEVSSLLGVHGRVLPATNDPVVLKAELSRDGDNGERVVRGQVAVQSSGGIVRVSLVPPEPSPPAAVLDAIREADQVVIGPGSLYTSVVAVVAVPAIREALAASSAQKVYVCNLRPEVPETEGLTVAAHVDALRAHGAEVDLVLCQRGALPRGDLRVPWEEHELARPDGLAHDPARLAAALSRVGSG